jgi:hypothetical protein
MRHAAHVIACLWKGIPDPRNSYAFWYMMFNTSWGGYGRLERVTSDDALRAREIKQIIEGHPLIKEVVPDECWNPFQATESSPGGP